MRSKASSPASPKFSAPASIFPIPTGQKQSAPAGQALSPRSFDVLHLLPQFFNLGLDFQSQPGDGKGFAFDAGRFRKKRVGLAMHFLEEKVQLLPHLARRSEEHTSELQ